MNAVDTLNHPLHQRYQEALGAYLETGGEAPLNDAYELGREAMAGGGLLALVSVHHRASAALVDRDAPDAAECARRMDAAGRFLIEVLSPFEVLQLGHKEANAALRRLNQILEEEAKRIAHALHDEAAQLLATVYLELSELRRAAPETLHEAIERITGHLDLVREQLRRLSHELRPPILDQLGLLPALQFLADGFRKRSKLDVTVSGSSGARFEPDIETALYRAVQEAFNNVVRHAQAASVNVRVWTRKNTLYCTITDDGVGFNPKGDRPAGLGLLGIRERIGSLHGTMTVRSAPGKGTQIHISIPLTASR